MSWSHALWAHLGTGLAVAALLLGLLEVLTQGYVNPQLGNFGQNFHAVLPYIIMVAFLWFTARGA